MFARVDAGTPAGAVAWFLRNDIHPAVTALRRDRRDLVEEIERRWSGLTKAQRYENLRSLTRLSWIAPTPATADFARMPHETRLTVARVIAAAVLLGFLWEREYGGDLREIASRWEPLSPEEAARELGLGGRTPASEP